MLKSLKYKVTFASTGKTFEGEYNFEKGLTAITGPNESGKSLIVEMIRYALFGTKALRGAMSGYQSIETTVTFMLPLKSDEPYTVSRTKSSCKLQHQNKPIASGTKPVNGAIETLLGYNLEVFDVSNACLQGQVEALSDKTPAERKRMVDRTIGLDTIDKVIKNVSEKTTSNRKIVETLQSTLQVLEEPIKPEGYEPSEELGRKIRELEVDNTRLIELKAWLQHACVDEPEAPTISITETLEQLLEGQKTYENVKSRIHYLTTKMEGLPRQYVAKNSGSFSDRKKAISDWEIQRDFPKPTISREQLVEENLRLENEEQLSKLASLQARKANLESQSRVSCPKCSHDFPLEQTAIDAIDSEINTVVTRNLPKPSITQQEYQVYIEQWNRYDARPFSEEVTEPEETLNDVQEDERQYNRYQEYLEYRSELNAQEDIFNEMFDRTETINQKRLEDAKQEEYTKQKTKYDDFVTSKDEVEREVKELTHSTKAFQELKDVYPQCVTYDKLMETYTELNQVMVDRQLQIDDLEKQIKNDENVKKGLKELKPKVKMYLVPSLNKVASSLISQMTQGERNIITIDEEFNIKVDNQSIEELSGSGKAVANLAIRIGLGTVLTNKVFSVFLADEVDAAMDESRAAYTAECLRNLKSTIGQIVIVSHQKPDADYQIELRK